MPELVEPTCDQPDCPIATEGRCLEGFPSGQGCPHLQLAESPLTDAPTETIPEPESEPEGSETAEWLTLEGGESLSSAEAHTVAAEYGATTVLLAGESESGKTTLIVELYARFLEGPVNGWKFGGSKTLFALDRRHLPTRYASGRSKATTERTQPEHEGLLHLRLAKNGRMLSPFLTDLRGERFEHVADGVPASTEVPFVRQAYHTLILVDGQRISATSTRQQAIHRARQLIGGLTESDAVPTGRPMAIVLTKRDLLATASFKWFEAQAKGLASFASSRGAIPTVMSLAARPDANPDSPEGLERMLSWMSEEEEALEADIAGSDDGSTGRQFWRFSIGDP